MQLIQFVLGTLSCSATLYADFLNKCLSKANERTSEQAGWLTSVEFAKLDFSDWMDLLSEKLSVVVYLLICVLGLFASPYYYSIHLFYLFSKISVLENVYEALVKNFSQLFYLALFGVGFFVVFSILTLSTYAPFSEEKYCQTLLECFMVVYNKVRRRHNLGSVFGG